MGANRLLDRYLEPSSRVPMCVSGGAGREGVRSGTWSVCSTRSESSEVLGSQGKVYYLPLSSCQHIPVLVVIIISINM